MKKAFFVMGILLLTIGLVNGVSQEELNETKSLIDSKVACNKLTNDQLEVIGEYYMEQMMPGEAHKRAHEMMGLKDGSEAEEQFHITIAKRSYCGENIGMMGGIMGGGMMGNYPVNYSYGYNSFWNIFWQIFLIVVIALVIWIIYNLIRKGNESKTPVSILKTRYAKGEISKKQFEEMKKEIGGDGYGKR